MKKLHVTLIFAVTFFFTFGVIYGYYWINEHSPILPRYEIVRFDGINVLEDAAGSSYFLVMNISNVGKADCIVKNNSVLFDGKPSNAYLVDTPVYFFTNTTIVQGGGTTTLYVVLPKGETWASGTNVDIAFQAQTGRTYDTTVELP